MEKGLSHDTSFVLRCIGKDTSAELERFTEEVSQRNFTILQNPQQIDNLFGNITEDYLAKLTSDEQAHLRSYTGYEFMNINATMRGKWNYEDNGLLTEEKKQDYLLRGENITKVIGKFPPLGVDIKTYRGTNIKAFWDYGITSLNDLPFLIGNYIYEAGFTSSALVRDNSFFVKQPEWRYECNIEIEYLVPGETSDGALLHSDHLSYSKNQTEYVFNSGSLFKVIDVKVDLENNKAYITAVIMPKIIWDPNAIELRDNLAI